MESSKGRSFGNLEEKGTLSYQYINSETVENSKLCNISVIGCNINNSSFQHVDFQSTDFDGTIILNCKTENINWTYTDFCSLTAVDSEFINVDFSSSTMRNCDFTSCIFTNCNFNHIALSDSSFNNCRFDNINLIESSTYLNIYSNCSFFKCNINGNFYYNFMINNLYKETNFQKKLISYNYFDLLSLEYIGFDHLALSSLKSYLMDHKLLINYVITDMNCNKNIDLSVLSFIAAVGKLIDNDILIRDEQLSFIQKLIYYFIDKNLISPVTIVESWSCVDQLMSKINLDDNIAFSKAKGSLNEIRNTLYFYYLEMGQKISYLFDEKSDNLERVVKIVYEEEPGIPICQIINEIKDSLGISDPNSYRIKSEKGSFIEWISCYDSVVACLELFISVIGVGLSIKSNLSNENNIISQEESISFGQEEGQLIELFNSALKKQKFNPEVNQTISIVLKEEIVAKKNFKGYKKSNIRSIDIITQNN